METLDTSAPARADVVAASTRSCTSARLVEVILRMPMRSPARRRPAGRARPRGRGRPRLAGIIGVVPCGGLERRRRILYGPRHGARVVDALIGAEAVAEVRHDAERGLVAHDAAERRGDAKGAALVAAEGDVHLDPAAAAAEPDDDPPVTYSWWGVEGRL
jgi:hypothetical protein